MTSERALQNEIRNALTDRGLFFRANVGTGWQGKVERVTSPQSVWVTQRDVVIRDARPFDTGLPNGFSDLFGLTQDGRFVAIEVKAQSGRLSPAQGAFLMAVSRCGGFAGEARSVEQAIAIVEDRRYG